MDGRSPRLHLALTLWTLLLIGLVLADVRHLPPGLTVLLVPYLALMAWHWIRRLRQRNPVEPAIPLDDAAGTPPGEDPDQPVDSPECADRFDPDDIPQPASDLPPEEPTAPPSRRGRARRRTRAPEVEPSAASWVQIQPGRFVRVEEMSPEPPADESGSGSRVDEPRGVPSDEPGTTQEAGSISEDADLDVPESEVEIKVQVASQDAKEVRG